MEEGGALDAGLDSRGLTGARERSALVAQRVRRAVSRTAVPIAMLCCFEVFSWQVSAQSDPAFVCPTDKPEAPWKDGDAKTYFCCREPRWENDWCYHESCSAGEDCTANNQTTCPDLSECLCFRRINYMTRTSCSLVKSCEQARRDMSMAKKKVLELTDFRVDELSGCQRALEGVICAYHFPKCIHDFHEQEKICMRTCDDVMKFCQYRQPDCKPGSNVTLVDGKGQPILDENGQEQLVACNQTASYFEQAQAAGEAAGEAAAGAAQSVDDASGGAISSGASNAGAAASSAASSASNAASGASNAMDGGRRRMEEDVIGGGYDSLESLRRAALYEALLESEIPEYLVRKLRPLAAAASRESFAEAQRASSQNFILRQDTTGTPEAAETTGVDTTETADAPGGNEDNIDTSEEYYARFKGKVTLSHFAQVGSRCDACLDKADMLEGKTCNGPEDEGRDSDHWKCAYNTRYSNGDCTARSARICASRWALVAGLTLSAAVIASII